MTEKVFILQSTQLKLCVDSLNGNEKSLKARLFKDILNELLGKIQSAPPPCLDRVDFQKFKKVRGLSS